MRSLRIIRRPMRLLRPTTVAALAALAAASLTIDAAKADQATVAPAVCAQARSLVDALRDEGRLAEAEAEAAATVNGSSRLFRLERDARPPSYLFGTMHSAHPDVTRLPPATERAFAAARTLVVESVDALDEAKLAAALFGDPALTQMPDGETLDDVLDEAGRAKVEAALSEAGGSYGAMRRMKPWLATMALMETPCQVALAREKRPILDLALAERARAAGKAIEGLESAGEQLAAMGAVPLGEQADGLVAAAEQRDRIPDVMATIRALYLEGRIGLIMPVLEAALPEAADLIGRSEGASAFETRMIDDRNATMAHRLAPLLEPGGAFVAVGALHLPGDAGLVALLRTAGWTVEPVAADAR